MLYENIVIFEVLTIMQRSGLCFPQKMIILPVLLSFSRRTSGTTYCLGEDFGESFTQSIP
jgi:hypothetical protein